jgi:D-glycero-alpha-D-manno-heptose-7-phosphate kinase
VSSGLRTIFENNRVEGSAPCRIDMGGTLDINTFSYPLRHQNPCTFNIALDLSTRVRILPYREEMVKVSSKGFESAEFRFDRIPFDHPLGLIFAIAAYFGVHGIHIDVRSSSPPRSALGGSSSAGVALVALFGKAFEKMGHAPLSRSRIALLAQAIEASIAGVPCGLQDQLAAVFGGVNVWHWTAGIDDAVFIREPAVGDNSLKTLDQHLLVAYCGLPHESRDINGRWIKQFLRGENRGEWTEIVHLTRRFVLALKQNDYDGAAELMNMETGLRRQMTPDVLDDMGEKLFDAAKGCGCGARFTGAGGGGCVWALGRKAAIGSLGKTWQQILTQRPEACLLDAKIDHTGVRCDVVPHD